MRIHVTALVLAGGLIAACGDGGTPPPPPPDALAVGTAGPPARFVPATGTVAEGGTVTWTNRAPAAEGIVHDITSDDNLWIKPELASGESFSFTFDEAGSYTYRCTLHAGMTGVIHVE
jgi:plastocyanin